MKARNRVMYGAGLTAGFLIFAATAAQAQTAESVPAPAADDGQTQPAKSPPAPAADNGQVQASPAEGVGDIVVTAQRRSENLQRVPIAVSVVTGDQALARGIVSTESLAQAVPGLTFSKFIDQATPSIRGIGSTILGEGNENSVAVYVDGVLQQTPIAAVFSLANISQVEVLKGPQGTLFGRNAVGGVINVTTLTPSQRTTIDASVGYGNYQTMEGKLYASTGITPTIAANLSVFYSNQDTGFGRNVTLGQDIYKSEDLVVRSKWLWSPSSATEVTLQGSYNRSSGNGSCLKLAYGEKGPDGIVNTDGYYEISQNRPCTTARHGYDVSLRLQQDLGFANLVSISAYSREASNRPGDTDYTPSEIQSAPAIDQLDHGWTQELQLQSLPGSPITWIAGAYYINSAAIYPEPNGITLTGPSLGGLPYFRILGRESTDSLAAFGQATATIFSNTRLTLGGRYTSDKRSIDAFNSSENLFLGGQKASVRFNKFTYRVSLDHSFSDNVLAYATVSTGFKAGLYDLTSPTNPPVKPETLTAYEVGLKTTLFDHRVRFNSAAYYYDYNNLQIVASDVRSGATTQLLNAAKARIKGVDMDLSARLLPGLNLQAGFSYIDATYSSFPEALLYIPQPGGGRLPVVFDAKGKMLTKVPKTQFNIGGDYRIPVGTGSVTLAANFSHQSTIYWDFDNQYKDGPRDLLSGSLAWAPTKQLEIRAWGANLLNRKYAVIGLETVNGRIYLPGSPRTYGLTLRVKLP